MAWREWIQRFFNRFAGRELRRIEGMIRIAKLGEKHGVLVPVVYAVESGMPLSVAREIFFEKLEEQERREARQARLEKLSGYDRVERAQRLRSKFKIVGETNG